MGIKKVDEFQKKLIDAASFVWLSRSLLGQEDTINDVDDTI